MYCCGSCQDAIETIAEAQDKIWAFYELEIAKLISERDKKIEYFEALITKLTDHHD